MPRSVQVFLSAHYKHAGAADGHVGLPSAHLSTATLQQPVAPAVCNLNLKSRYNIKLLLSSDLCTAKNNSDCTVEISYNTTLKYKQDRVSVHYITSLMVIH